MARLAGTPIGFRVFRPFVTHFVGTRRVLSEAPLSIGVVAVDQPPGGGLPPRLLQEFAQFAGIDAREPDQDPGMANPGLSL